MANSTELVLSAAHLSKSYGAQKALDDVDLEVRRGEFVVLLGPNGAGKSTLLQILTGLFSPDSGAITLVGYDLRRNTTEALRHLGVVFQQPTLDLELSVSANLFFHTDLHGIPRREARSRIAEALARFHLAARAGDQARQLSGGNRRRVELARALLHRPKILLMDEATVGLDPLSRRDLLQHILRLRRDEGIGVLWTTHLIDEAKQADRIVVLHKGRVRFSGPLANLLEVTAAATLDEAFLRLTGPTDGGAETEWSPPQR